MPDTIQPMAGSHSTSGHTGRRRRVRAHRTWRCHTTGHSRRPSGSRGMTSPSRVASPSSRTERVTE